MSTLNKNVPTTEIALPHGWRFVKEGEAIKRNDLHATLLRAGVGLVPSVGWSRVDTKVFVGIRRTKFGGIWIRKIRQKKRLPYWVDPKQPRVVISRINTKDIPVPVPRGWALLEKSCYLLPGDKCLPKHAYNILGEFHPSTLAYRSSDENRLLQNPRFYYIRKLTTLCK